ncbi:hypothetical protein FQR65_LT17166 [Abscondita terminalis]|nr:hypothetical protein FQR65_LT17166 [Abscondita terminalis]
MNPILSPSEKKTKRLIEEYDVEPSKNWVNRKIFTLPSDASDHMINRDVQQSSRITLPTSSNIRNSIVHGDMHSISNRSTPTSSCSQITTTYNNDQQIELLQAILKTQTEIKFEINELKNKIEKMENRQIIHNMESGLPETVFLNKLPIKELSKVNEVENLIKDEIKFNELVREFVIKLYSCVILKKNRHRDIFEEDSNKPSCSKNVPDYISKILENCQSSEFLKSLNISRNVLEQLKSENIVEAAMFKEGSLEWKLRRRKIITGLKFYI